MRKSLSVILFLILFTQGCTKSGKPDTSGTITLNNNLYGTTDYYAFGFSFSKADKVSTHGSPGPDITVDNDGTLLNLRLLTNSYTNSFYKAGEYANATSAGQAFNNLTSPVVPQWEVWADSVRPNQIWIYKTSAEKYAKIRIISTLSETRTSRDYAECSFEWVYQPDGSLTFPGK